MKNQFKVGNKYTIQFWDHCKGSEALLCEVTLWITKEDKDFVYGTWWRIIDDEEAEEDNREMVTIIKSTIAKKRSLALL